MRTPRSPYVAKRRCRGSCRRVLPLTAYHLDAEALDGRQAYCPECKASATREARWLRQYGLTAGRAQACLALQDDLCPLCNSHIAFNPRQGLEKGWTLCVDHDHDTGEVRGLVHSRCNLSPPQNALGSARWLAYCRNPPMRVAHAGKPLIAPVSGMGEVQFEMDFA